MLRFFASSVSLCTGLALFMANFGWAQELPTGHGCDVINANGTDQNDDTQAFLTGIHPTSEQWKHTYVPPGTYYVSNTIKFEGDRGRFFTLRGAGPEKTVIRLKANSPGFGDTLRPKEVFFFVYSNNATHSVFLEHLTIEIEAGNPGAVAYRCGAHNGGGITNVVVRAAQGSGFIGIDLRDTPGPEYLENVKVYGFNKGIYIAGGMYCVTMDRIHIEGQRTYGIHNLNVPTQISNLTSNNTCRGIQSGGGGLMLINATFTGGSSGQYAAVSTSSSVVRNLTIEGSAYTYSFGDAFKNVIKQDKVIVEYVGESVKTTIPSPLQPLAIPVNNVPDVPWDPPANWGNINSMGGLQAAINSGSKSTLFYPGNSEPSGGDVRVNNSAVKRIVGFGRLYPGTVYFDNPDPNSVVICDQLRFGSVVISTAGKVVLKSFMANDITISGTGETYINDYCCGVITVNGAKVWCRQLNTETAWTPAFAGRVINNGGQLTILGLKTEGSDCALENRGGAKTNVFGGFIYPGDWFGVPDGPAFINDNSDIALFHNQLTWTYPLYIREIRAGMPNIEKTLNELKFGGSCAYVTNPNGNAHVMPADVKPIRLSAQVLSEPSAVVVLTPDKGDHQVCIYSMQGRLVFAAQGMGARDYRFEGGRNTTYVVKVKAGKALTTAKAVCRN